MSPQRLVELRDKGYIKDSEYKELMQALEPNPSANTIDRNDTVEKIYDHFMTEDGKVYDLTVLKCIDIVKEMPPSVQKAVNPL